MDISIALLQTDFLKGISDKSRAALAEICIPKTLDKKEQLFFEGDKGTALYLCASGNVQLYKSGPDAKEIVIKVIGPGELFGEVILFERDTYPVSAVAVRKSQLFVMPKKQFNELLSHDDFRKDFINMLMKKQRYLTDQIKYLTMHDVEDRLFLFLQEHYGRKEVVIPRMSKKDIAAAIATTPETLSRIIARLEDEKLLIWSDGEVRILPKVWDRF